jgi:hypothetical protein
MFTTRVGPRPAAAANEKRSLLVRRPKEAIALDRGHALTADDPRQEPAMLFASSSPRWRAPTSLRPQQPVDMRSACFGPARRLLSGSCAKPSGTPPVEGAVPAKLRPTEEAP